MRRTGIVKRLTSIQFSTTSIDVFLKKKKNIKWFRNENNFRIIEHFVSVLHSHFCWLASIDTGFEYFAKIKLLNPILVSFEWIQINFLKLKKDKLCVCTIWIMIRPLKTQAGWSLFFVEGDKRWTKEFNKVLCRYKFEAFFSSHSVNRFI